MTDVLGKVEWKCIAGDCLQISRCQLEDSWSTKDFEGPDLGIVSLGVGGGGRVNFQHQKEKWSSQEREERQQRR